MDGRGKGLIGVVDEDDAVRRALGEALRRQGYRVLAAGTLPQAVEALAHVRGDLALLEARLVTVPQPAAPCPEILERLHRAVGYRLPVVFTAQRSEDLGAYAACGFDALLLKPWVAAEVVARVQRQLRPSRRG